MDTDVNMTSGLLNLVIYYMKKPFKHAPTTSLVFLITALGYLANVGIGRPNTDIRNRDESKESVAADPTGQIVKKPKTILYWNAFFGNRDFTFGFGEEPLTRNKCPVSSCFFTDDRSLFNESDIIIFSVQGLDSNDVPKYRFPHQRFVFYELESPENTDLRSISVNAIRYGFFNLTMTYRLDSDVINRFSYGITIPKTKSQPSFFPVPNDPLLPSKTHLNTPPSMNVTSKTKMVAWFVSHCKTKIRREDYVSELGKYVPVDIYGKCSNVSCNSRGMCWEMLRNDYKFYIAFENSLCPDYVTEKLTRTLHYDTVPLVMGGVDYNRFAPPHSFINVFDFASPKQLADYLLLLNSTDDLYLRYYDWKRDYTISLMERKGVCQLCAIANDPNYPNKVYQDVIKWWVEDAKCHPGWTAIKN